MTDPLAPGRPTLEQCEQGGDEVRLFGNQIRWTIRVLRGRRFSDNGRNAKKAGDQITCLKCGGKSYTAEGFSRDLYPVECSRCNGKGVQVVRPQR